MRFAQEVDNCRKDVTDVHSAGGGLAVVIILLELGKSAGDIHEVDHGKVFVDLFVDESLKLRGESRQLGWSSVISVWNPVTAAVIVKVQA